MQLKGIIKNLVRDFGFIKPETGDTDYFFHESTVLDKSIKLKIGQVVNFELRPNKGQAGYHAINVEILGEKAGKPPIPKKKKLKYFFDDKDDLIFGLHYIIIKLISQKSKKNLFEDSDFIEEQTGEIIDLINDLRLGAVPNIDTINVEDINNSESSSKKIDRDDPNYWLKTFDLQNFAEKIENISSIEPDKSRKHDFSIVWHEWKDRDKQLFHVGYSKDHFNYSFIEKGEKEQTSVYDRPPPNAIWKIKKIKQKEHSFYIGSAPANEIAQSCSVPALPPKIGIIETSERILNKHRNVTEWQRELDSSRIRKISQFIEESNNIIANAPMLYIHDEGPIKIINDSLIIDFSKFLQKQTSNKFKGKFIDRKPREKKDEFGNVVYDDYRPMWIIDGQHRVRGINRSPEEQNLLIPVIIFPQSFDMANTAKIFAEINTLQKKLNPLHELFMQHRFSIDHTNVKRKFRDYKSNSIEQAENEGWLDDWEHSRANHLSYEISAMLAKNGTLKNRVTFLPQNLEKKDVFITADQWVNYSRDWFFSKCYKYKGDGYEYIYNPNINEKKMAPIDIFYKEINNYFKAWVNTCNHSDWPDGKKRWIEGIKGKALIQRKTHFVILIEIYNLVHMQAMLYKRKNKLSGIIKTEVFMKILEPFKWVDWSSKDLLDIYGGGGEKGRRSLEAWMADAIINGEQFSLEQIFNTNIKSVPGKGINSRLGTPSLYKKSAHDWPTKNKSIKFISTRPWNARYESQWRVEDNNNDLRGDPKISVAKQMGPLDAEFILKHEKYMDDPSIKKLTIRVDWKNSHTVTGHNTVTIRKPT